MKRMVLLITLIVITSGTIYAQKCNLQGVVRYKYNEHLGYKIAVSYTHLSNIRA